MERQASPRDSEDSSAACEKTLSFDLAAQWAALFNEVSSSLKNMFTLRVDCGSMSRFVNDLQFPSRKIWLYVAYR